VLQGKSGAPAGGGKQAAGFFVLREKNASTAMVRGWKIIAIQGFPSKCWNSNVFAMVE